jgi:hypothetical protein
MAALEPLLLLEPLPLLELLLLLPELLLELTGLAGEPRPQAVRRLTQLTRTTRQTPERVCAEFIDDGPTK